jgi:hypothetical protein
VAIILVAIDGYYISGCWWLFVVIFLVVGGGYSIDGYWLLFY